MDCQAATPIYDRRVGRASAFLRDTALRHAVHNVMGPQSGQYIPPDSTLDMLEDAITIVNNLAPGVPRDDLAELEQHLQSLRIGGLTPPKTREAPKSAPLAPHRPLVVWDSMYRHPKAKIAWAYTKSPEVFNIPSDPQSSRASGGFQRLNSAHFLADDSAPYKTVFVQICDDRSFTSLGVILNLQWFDWLMQTPSESITGHAGIDFGPEEDRHYDVGFTLTLMDLPSPTTGTSHAMFRLSVDREVTGINLFFQPSHLLEFLGGATSTGPV